MRLLRYPGCAAASVHVRVHFSYTLGTWMAGAVKQTLLGVTSPFSVPVGAGRHAPAPGVVFLVRARTCSGSLSATKLVCDSLE